MKRVRTLVVLLGDQLDLEAAALTAGVMPEERAKAMAAGVDNFLTKPLDLEQMVHILATIRAGRLRA